MQKIISKTECPVSAERVDENVVRLGAFFVIVLAITSLYFHNIWLMCFLCSDFALRAFTSANLSLIKLASKYFAQKLNLPKKQIDAAPKKFSAGLGFVLCAFIALTQHLAFFEAEDILGAILILCAGLESLAGYCVGCQIYTWIALPFLRNFGQSK